MDRPALTRLLADSRCRSRPPRYHCGL
jgi:hypothetical protein